MNLKKTFQKIDFYKLGKLIKNKSFVYQIIVVLIVFIISWDGIKAIYMNASIKDQIEQAKIENQNQQLINQNLNLQNDYYNSSEYVRLQARANFGLGVTGEKELIVPYNVAISFVPKLGGENLKSSPQDSLIKNNFQQNISDWTNYFLNRKPLN